MSMINKVRLEEFANGLWAKIKMKIGEGVVNVAFNQQTNTLTATKGDNTTIDVDLTSLIGVSDITFNDATNILTVSKGDGTAPVEINLTSLIGVEDITYNTTTKIITVTKGDGTNSELNLSDFASLSQNNLFDGVNIFNNDIYLTTKEPIGENLPYSGNAGGTKRVGRRDYTSHSNGNKGFVKSLIVRLSSGMGQGTSTTAKVWEVKKGETHLQDEPALLIDTTKFIVKENTTWNKYIEIPILKQYAEETYFIYEIIPSSHMAYANVARGDDNVIYIDNQEVTADNINSNKGGTTSGIYALIVGMNIKDMIQNAGTVKSVNTINPDVNGNVQLTADNFNDIYSKTESNNKFVPKTEVGNEANKIPRLDTDGKLVRDILPSITINDTFAVEHEDEVEAKKLAMQQIVEGGDMMLVTSGVDPDKVTKKYICIDATKTNFEEKFIELSFPTDGVTEAELTAKLQEYVRIADTGTSADQVLRLDGQGKIDDNNLKLATSQEINDIINALQ